MHFLPEEAELGRDKYIVLRVQSYKKIPYVQGDVGFFCFRRKITALLLPQLIVCRGRARAADPLENARRGSGVCLPRRST